MPLGRSALSPLQMGQSKGLRCWLQNRGSARGAGRGEGAEEIRVALEGRADDGEVGAGRPGVEDGVGRS